jgi:hypothetical protein
MSNALLLDGFTGSTGKYHDLEEPTATAAEKKGFTGSIYVTYGRGNYVRSPEVAEPANIYWSIVKPGAMRLRLMKLTSVIAEPVMSYWLDPDTQTVPSSLIDDHFSSITADVFTADANEDIEIEATLNELEAQWREETSFLSSMSAKIDNQWYQKIIALGQPVIPLLLKRLQKTPDHWFEALRKLTLENPVKDRPEIRGDMTAMSECWVSWGKKRGYL